MLVPYTRISLRMEFICGENRLYFERQYMKIFGSPNTCTEAVLITDEMHIKLISFASHVYVPYSVQIDSKPSVNTQNFLIWRMLCLNPYSEQIRCMSNANKRISSIVMLTGFVTECLYIKRLTRTLFGGLNNVCSPYSAQLRCKLFVII